MAADPVRIKRIAFGISIATASLAGAFLIIIQPVEPSIGRDYIGRIFAICVLGGMGSFPGTVIAAMLLGVVESITATFYGPSWAPAVAFGFLLLTLAVRRPACSGASDARPRRLPGSSAVAGRRSPSLAAAAADSTNEYFFFAAYMVLQYIVLATAWKFSAATPATSISAPRAFFAVGAYSAVVLHKLTVSLPLPAYR